MKDYDQLVILSKDVEKCFISIDTLIDLALENDYPKEESKDLAVACFSFGAFLIKQEKKDPGAQVDAIT